MSMSITLFLALSAQTLNSKVQEIPILKRPVAGTPTSGCPVKRVLNLKCTHRVSMESGTFMVRDEGWSPGHIFLISPYVVVVGGGCENCGEAGGRVNPKALSKGLCKGLLNAPCCMPIAR